MALKTTGVPTLKELIAWHENNWKELTDEQKQRYDRLLRLRGDKPFDRKEYVEQIRKSHRPHNKSYKGCLSEMKQQLDYVNARNNNNKSVERKDIDD